MFQISNTVKKTLLLFFIALWSIIIFSCNLDTSKRTLKDIDGEIYRTVKIGKQTWMAENLRVTSFNDGEPILMIRDGKEWYDSSVPSFCWYNNDSASYSVPYGALYNYHAINSGKLCPSGWRVPTRQDFQVLISVLDSKSNFVRHEASTSAGGMLKATEPTNWSEPNIAASNKSGFSALPGGCRSWAGDFSMLERTGYFGSSTDNTALAVRSASGSAFLRRGISSYVGVSVRCIKE
jgi:uncharacterized protein (TIGR02145 family)